MTPKRVTDDQLLAHLQNDDTSNSSEGDARAARLLTAAQIRAVAEQKSAESRRTGFAWWKAVAPVAALSVVIGAWVAVPSIWPGGKVGVDTASETTGGDAATVGSPIEPTKTIVDLGDTIVGIANLKASGNGFVKFSQRDVDTQKSIGSLRDRYWPVSGGNVYTVHYDAVSTVSEENNPPRGSRDITYLMVQSHEQALGGNATVLRGLVSSLSAREITAEKASEVQSSYLEQVGESAGKGSFERALDDLLTFGLADASQRATWLTLLASSSSVSKDQHLGKEVVVVSYQVEAVRDEKATSVVMLDSKTGVVVARRHIGSVTTGFGANADISVVGVTQVPTFVLDAFSVAQRDGRCSSDAGFPVCQLSGGKKPGT